MTVYEKRILRACDEIRRTMGPLDIDSMEEALLNSQSGLAAIDIEYLAARIKALQDAANKPWWQRLLGW